MSFCSRKIDFVVVEPVRNRVRFLWVFGQVWSVGGLLGNEKSPRGGAALNGTALPAGFMFIPNLSFKAGCAEYLRLRKLYSRS